MLFYICTCNMYFYLFIVIRINIEELRPIKVKLFSPEILERDYLLLEVI